MIASAIYGFVAAILVLVITFMVIILTSRFAEAGYGVMYGSLFIKMVTLSAFTLAVKPYLGDAIIYAAICLLYTSPSPRDATLSRMPSSA